MYCKSCSEEVPAGISYCPYCGADGDFKSEKLPVQLVRKVHRERTEPETTEQNLMNEVMEPLGRKGIKWLMAFFCMVILALAVYLLIDNRTAPDREAAIGFYSDEMGVFFVESGNHRIYDDMTNITKEQMFTNVQYYRQINNLYKLNYYMPDQLIATNITRFYEPLSYSKQIVYKLDKEYMVYDGENTFEVDFEGHNVYDIDYFNEGEIIAIVTIESVDEYHLYLYEDEEMTYVDSSDSTINYVEYYNDRLYYVVDNESSQYKCFEGNESELLVEGDGRGSISAMPHTGISIVSTVEGGSLVFRDNRIVGEFDDVDYVMISHANEDNVFLMVSLFGGFTMFKIDVDNQITEIDADDASNYVERSVDLTNEDTQTRIEFIENTNEIEYIYRNEDNIEVVLTYSYDDFRSLDFDKSLQTMYGLDRNGNLISTGLLTGIVEEIEKNVSSYNVFGLGVVYVSSESGNINFKEGGQKAVTLIEGTPGETSWPYVISYDDINLYIQMIEMDNMESMIAPVYYFDSESYYLKKIADDVKMYYIYTHETSEMTWGSVTSEF